MNMKCASIRWLNVLIGAWLFLSAFVWSHSDAQFTNACIVGLLTVGAALLGMRVPWARHVNAVIASWLFVSACVLPLELELTFWNNLLAAIIMLFVALTPNTPIRSLLSYALHR
jgi:hypothetical protein